MKIMKPLSVGLVIFLCAARIASAAQPDMGRRGFGLGIILGEPTGISVKKWIDKDSAIDGAAAWAFSGSGSFQVHADYLQHVYNLIDTSAIDGRLPFYYGLGGRVKFHDEHDGMRKTWVGLRIPLGLTYLPDHQPFDVFFELVPVLDLSPSTDFSLTAAIGGRFYF